MRHHLAVASLALIAAGSAAAGAIAEKTSTTAETSAVSAVHSAPSSIRVQAEQHASLTREEILKEGPAALEQNCTKCHGSDKWEGTNRDHDGWAAIVNEMSRQMAQAQMPPMSERTTNLIVDYLTLTHPQ